MVSCQTTAYTQGNEGRRTRRIRKINYKNMVKIDEVNSGQTFLQKKKLRRLKPKITIEKVKQFQFKKISSTKSKNILLIPNNQNSLQYNDNKIQQGYFRENCNEAEKVRHDESTLQFDESENLRMFEENICQVFMQWENDVLPLDLEDNQSFFN